MAAEGGVAVGGGGSRVEVEGRGTGVGVEGVGVRWTATEGVVVRGDTGVLPGVVALQGVVVVAVAGGTGAMRLSVAVVGGTGVVIEEATAVGCNSRVVVGTVEAGGAITRGVVEGTEGAWDEEWEEGATEAARTTEGVSTPPEWGPLIR